MMGELMTTMVAYDAFTQALTNPLLARNVFNEATFTRAGLKIIEKTQSLQQILARNSTVRRGRLRQLPVLRPSRPGVEVVPRAVSGSTANVLACPLDCSPRTPCGR